MSDEWKKSDTPYGFEWGSLEVERAFCDMKAGWVTVLLKTPKYPRGIQVYVTKTGKIRVFADGCEWKPEGAKK